jgi:alpha-glucosidase
LLSCSPLAGAAATTLLNLGLSGVPLVGSDVGGYSGDATPELYARWMQLGSISPFFRGHVTSGVPGQEPWAFSQ